VLMPGLNTKRFDRRWAYYIPISLPFTLANSLRLHQSA
jgi:hypothetical protein